MAQVKLYSVQLYSVHFIIIFRKSMTEMQKRMLDMKKWCMHNIDMHFVFINYV
jgi:hypothetical protein